jgi:transcriptional regulator with XRE-family HTH domain
MKTGHSALLRKNLLRLVRLRQITLEQLAIEADCTKGYISHIVGGRNSPSLDLLDRIADALKVPLHELFRP